MVHVSLALNTAKHVNWDSLSLTTFKLWPLASAFLVAWGQQLEIKVSGKPTAGWKLHALARPLPLVVKRETKRETHLSGLQIVTITDHLHSKTLVCVNKTLRL